MRIAIAVTQGEHGGVQDYLWRFMAWLKSQGHEVALFCGPGDWLMEKSRELGIPAYRITKLTREISFSNILAIFELKRLLQDFHPDAVDLNSSMIGAIGAISARLARVPHIAYRIGGWVFLEDLPAWKKALYKWIERATARLKDVIVCVNPSDVEVAKHVGIKPKKRLVCVPNGIDLDSFRAELYPRDEARQKLSIPDGFVFGTLANLYPPKDLPRYMQACAMVLKQMPEARFVIIGEGQERGAIEAAIRELHLEDRVMLAGFRDDADRFFLAYDAFVLPSSKEGMSWALVRAMAAGLKCIATDVGAAKWMLGDTGAIVPPKNPAALAEAMCRISSIVPSHPDERFTEAKTLEGNFESLLA